MPYKDHEKQLKYLKDWGAAHRNDANANLRRRLAANPEKLAEQRRWQKYAVSPYRFLEMWAEQDGLCPGCCRPLASSRVDIDHDHRCCPGRTSCGSCVRGLLCHGCNTAMGPAGDDPECLRRLANYLEKYPHKARPPALALFTIDEALP